MLRTVALVVVAAAAVFAVAENAGTAAYSSPNGRYKAVVETSGGESRVSIFAASGARVFTHAFISRDRGHGYGVDGAYWTPNSRYFVCRLRSSGGHSPMFAPIVFWSQHSRRFYSLKNYTGDIAFAVESPDRVKASNWPDMTDAVIALHTLKPTDLVALRP